MSVSRRVVRAWCTEACEPSVVRRAIGYAIVVGALLIVINHGRALWAGDLTAGRLAQMGLTVMVPYAVSTLSSVGARRERGAQAGEDR